MTLRRDLPLQWRPMQFDDLLRINQIADSIHTGLPEKPEVFKEKFVLFPEGCFTYSDDKNIHGYGFAHPWTLYDIPSLDTFLEGLPRKPSCIFIHDVAIETKARGGGGAGTYIELVRTAANRRGISKLALVSVYDTHPLWSRFGFEIIVNDTLARKLKGYGDTAKYMICNLI